MHTVIIALIRKDGSPVYTEIVEMRGGDEPHIVEYANAYYRLISTGAPSALWIYEYCEPFVVGKDN